MNVKIYSTKINIDPLLIGKTEDVLSDLSNFFSEHTTALKNIVHIELLACLSNDELNAARTYLKDILRQVFKGNFPALTLSPAALPGKAEAELLITAFMLPHQKIEHKVYQKHHYTTITTPKGKVLISGGLHFNQGNDLMRNCQLSFDFMEQLLDHEEMHFGHILDQSISVGNNYTSVKSPQEAWQIVDQVKGFYFDPALFQQECSPLTFSTSCSPGVFNRFIAAANNTFPIHQDQLTVHEQVRVNTAYVPDWQILFFHTSCPGENQSKNPITQCQHLIQQLKESIKEHGSAGVSHITAYIREHNDAADIHLVLKEQFPEARIGLIHSGLSHAEALIELTGTVMIQR